MVHVPDPNNLALPSPDDLQKAASESAGRKRRAKKPTAKAVAADPTVEMLLSRCAVNLSDLAQRGELRQAYGRDDLVDAIWQLLRPDSSRKPLILGKARSGKTALAHEIARP